MVIFDEVTIINMNKQMRYFIILTSILLFNVTFSQESLKDNAPKITSSIYLEDAILQVKLSFSIKDLKKNTNDSTYIISKLFYKSEDSSWQNIAIGLRKRGNYRLANCYFPPLKIKLKKSDVKDTPFKGNKKMKIVLPCLIQKDNNDNVIKEYLAYKFFEIMSPYYFNTRLLNVTLETNKGKKNKIYNLKGFLVEDDKTVAKRFAGDVYKRKNHPLNHEPIASVRSALFQYMIGNTDFSQAYLHNMKVIYINKQMIPIPYDFDMSGFVNCSYAVVSQIGMEKLGLTSVTQRKYRGFVRDETVFKQVRQEMLSKKAEIMMLLDQHKIHFENPKEYTTCRAYILSFFDVLNNDKKFRNEIVSQARSR